jgi:hypothetical protein
MSPRIHAVSILLPTTLALALMGGCGPTSARGGRPVPLLTEEDRTPDPSCSAAWVAAMTARVVDGDGAPVRGAFVAPCLRLGDGTGTCLAPATTDARGWALASLEPSLRCVSRVALRVMAPDPSFATTYQTLAMTPEDAVLDVVDELVVVRTSPALSREGEASGPVAVRFEGDVTLELPASSLENPAALDDLGLVSLPGADAPAFMHQLGEPTLAIALGPDGELLVPGALELPAPAGAPDGTTFDLAVLGGLYTPLESGVVVDEGSLGLFGSATVREGRLRVAGLPRLGWIALLPR